MIKETYKPRPGFALIELIVFRPKKVKAVFVNDKEVKGLIKKEDVQTYRIKAIPPDMDLSVGDYVQLAQDLTAPSQFGTIVPEGAIISKVEYSGLEDYDIKTLAELVKERDGKSKAK